MTGSRVSLVTLTMPVKLYILYGAKYKIQPQAMDLQRKCGESQSNYELLIALYALSKADTIWTVKEFVSRLMKLLHIDSFTPHRLAVSTMSHCQDSK